MVRRQHGFVFYGSLILLLLTARAATAGSRESHTAFCALVQSDWTLQEKRRGRAPDDPDAIRDALRRGQQLVEDLSLVEQPPQLAVC